MNSQKTILTLIAIFIILVGLLLATDAHSAVTVYEGDTAKVSWQQEMVPDLAGFKVYFESTSGTTVTKDLPLSTVNQVDGRYRFSEPMELPLGTYDIWVTSYDQVGNESGPSNIVQMVLEERDETPPSAPFDFVFEIIAEQ